MNNNFTTSSGDAKCLMELSNISEYNLFDINKSNEINGLFFIKHSNKLSDYLKNNGDLPITSNQLLKLKKSKIIFINHTEPDSEDLVQVFDKVILDKKYDTTKFCIINNNSKLNLQINKNKSKIITHNTNSFFRWSSELMKPHKSEYSSEKEKFFTFHNRVIKPHRYFLLCELMKNNILDFIDWSFLRGYEIILSDGNLTPNFYQKLFNEEEVLIYSKEMNILNKIQTKKSIYEKFDGDVINPLYWSHNSKIDVYSNAYINIVGESNFFEDLVHISEKSFIPLWFYQIPIFLSSHHHVKCLKERYNFDLFDDLIDHSYDNETDNKIRFFKVLDEIIRIFKNMNDVKKFYISNKNRIMNNRINFTDIINSKSDYDFFLNFQNDAD
jgi:hypothetical protein